MKTTTHACVRAMLAALALVLMAACARAESYETAEELTAALNRSGVECRGAHASPEAQLVRSGASCTSGEARLDVYVFDGEPNRDSWLRVGSQLDAVAVGPNWVVSGDAVATQRAATALAGRFSVPEQRSR